MCSAIEKRKSTGEAKMVRFEPTEAAVPVPSASGAPPTVFAAAAAPVPCLYRMGRELGAGTYSVVSEVRHTVTGCSYAAKVVNKRLMRGRENLVKNEIAILERVSRVHPNVLTLVDFFETTDNLYLVTELARGGELFERICARGAYGESDSQWLMRQVVSGVAHLHAHGIVHRDLKLENLLFQTGEARSRLLICDFGLSRIIDDSNLRMLTTTVGTPSYMAPEVLTGKGHGKEVDIWAIGVIAYVMLCGFTPFDRDTDAEEREAILSADLKFEPVGYWMHITADAHNFIKSCIQVDPEKRPTAEELLQSKFLTRSYRSKAKVCGGEFGDDQDSDPCGEDPQDPAAPGRATMNGAFSLPPEKYKFAGFPDWR